MKQTILGKIRTNILGTNSIMLQIPGMRKEQDFIIYPIQKNETAQSILIQSSTRIGRIDTATGKGYMSQSHQSGAYGVHLQFDKLTPFELSPIDLQTLRMSIFTNAGDNVGSRGVLSDNSGAINILSL